MSHYFDFSNPLSIGQRAAVSGIFDSPREHFDQAFFEVGVLSHWLSLQDPLRVNESIHHAYQLDSLYAFYRAYRVSRNVAGRHASLLELFETGLPERAMRRLSDIAALSGRFSLSSQDAEQFSCLERRIGETGEAVYCFPSMALAANAVCLENEELTPSLGGGAFDGVLLHADVAANSEGFLFRGAGATGGYIQTSRVVFCGFHSANGYYVETEDRRRYLILTACINPILSIFSVADLLRSKQRHITANRDFFASLQWSNGLMSQGDNHLSEVA